MEPFDLGPAGRPPSSGPLRIVEDRHDGLGQGFRVIDRHEQARPFVDDALGVAPVVGGHARQPCGRRLQKHNREGIPLGWQDEAVHRGEQLRHVGAGAEEVHPRGNPEPVRLGPQLPL